MSEAAATETQAYRRDGYVALDGLFPVEVVRGFFSMMEADLSRGGRSLRSFAARGPLLTRDAIEVYAQQYPPMLGLLWGLTPRIAAATGCELLPTYAYFRLYQQGDVCRVHTDRPACEHSVSLTLGYGEDRVWPLSVGAEHVAEPRPGADDTFGAEPFASVPMRPGDGVLYQGVHRRHGRVSPNPNTWSAHLFLHWVDRNGRYADQAFDRPTIARAGATGTFAG